MISVQNLTLSLEGQRVLKDVSTTLPDHGITAIIGPNGAGKSTLLHSVAALRAPDSGSVTLNGADIHATPAAERAKLLAILTQSQPQIPRLTVRDLVAFGRWPHHRGRPGPEDHALVHAAISQFELHRIESAQLDTLSGGQRQRAYVAMAWAQGTPYMLLDEPLSALDPRVSRSIMSRLHQISRPGRDTRAVVIVLHDLQIAAQWADYVVALKDGELFAEGIAGSVLADAPLSALYDSEISVRPLDDGRIAVLT
ncbi:ATP-binding cassette domain-containing protein [Gymnodinialimonas ceratoperidinii]|uniref:ATP-binding cassette domain-containing protein n=1 Tax=Gymnodinialimonas ceratoperidinii TaxID=2856823 RepID=A0A8F6YA09_9RHOB|nr:ATP-binding cassette domain-containing protein [Gymnodinialimonas ceratoperidinii]QXT39489.1 ATP-binding cassette domain-containing protein [Gymnodinialimonas ceratoperidinii]